MDVEPGGLEPRRRNAVPRDEAARPGKMERTSGIEPALSPEVFPGVPLPLGYVREPAKSFDHTTIGP